MELDDSLCAFPVGLAPSDEPYNLGRLNAWIHMNETVRRLYLTHKSP